MPELTWARHENARVGLVLFRVPGGNNDNAGAALRAAVRGEELAFRVGQTQFLVELWNVNAAGMTIAIQRLGGAIQKAGHPVVEAGIACFPGDADDVDDLLAIARTNLLPIEERGAVQFDDIRVAPGPAIRFLSPLADVIVNLAIMLAALAAIFAVTPYIIDIPTKPLVPSLAAAFGVSLLVAIAFVFTWNRSGARLDRSAGPRRLGLSTIALMTMVIWGLFAWSIVQPQVPTALPFFGSQIVLVAALLGVLMQGRTLVFAPAGTLAIIAGLCAGIVFVSYVSHPIVADFARVIGAFAAGPLLARFIERLSWMLAVCIGITGVDIWSVYSSSGTTHKLAESKSSALDALLMTGPSINHSFTNLGTTDAFFLAVFCAFAYRWRLDMLRTVAALAVGLTVAFASTLFSPTGIPVLPFLAFVFVAVHAGRFYQDLVGVKQITAARAVKSAQPAPRGAGMT
ncbi:MAG: hypothetical protein H7123_06790 [Thermoleophilia bacterium]|nr:hypothetical protein [Thermoleophilia bacterium]